MKQKESLLKTGKNMAKNMVEKANQNKASILTGTGVLGLFATVGLSWKAGIKAEKILEKRKRDMADVAPDDKEARKAVNKEAIKEMIPVVLPVVAMGITTSACIIGSNTVSSKKIAVLSAAYSVSETAVKELNGKMQEVLGEKKTRVIKDAILKDKIGDAPKEEQVIITGDGDVLCKDSYSGRYFRSNAQKIGQAINRLSHDIITDMYVSLNDLYSELHIERIPMGDDLGWNIDDTQRGQLPVTYTAVLTDDGIPCLCIDYDVCLRADYRNLHHVWD